MTKSVFTEEYRTFRMLLVQARKQSKITQVEVSKRLGKPQSFVSKYESGERRLDLVEFLHVVEALEIDPIKFLRHLLENT